MKGKNVLNFFFEKEGLLAKRSCTFNADERLYEIIINIDHVDAIWTSYYNIFFRARE